MTALPKFLSLPHPRRIFNHDIMSCTAPGVTGNHLYSGRALGMTEPGDIIQLHPFLRNDWQVICDHYGRIGLSHATEVIWDVSHRPLVEHAERDASIFFFGPSENRVRPDTRWSRVVEYVNSKNNFMALASHLRLSVPRTLCFSGKQWFAGIEYFPYPCYLKAAVSVAGKGIYRCEHPSELIQALAHFDEDVPLQVQEEIDTDQFLNLQYLATDQDLERLVVTEQVLHGYTHAGNRYPTVCEPWASVEPMAEWLVEKGMRGVFAFDVAMVGDIDDLRPVPIECNPRFNGASYPSAVAHRLEAAAWVAKDFHTRHQRLSEIDLCGIEFDRTTGAGVVLVNWGTVLVGKLGVLMAGDLDEQQRLETELTRRL